MQSSVDFFTKLNGLGVPSTLTLIQGADHAFDNNAPDAVEVMAATSQLPDAQEGMQAFLEKRKPNWDRR